jgi:hypothetical protein
MPLVKFYNINKLIFSFAAVSILALSIGCSKASNNQPQAPSATQSMASIKPSPSVAYTEQQDQDLTKKLTSEKIVQSGKVYLTGDKAIATITVKKGTDEKTIKDLATNYANTMKQKYSKKRINVVAFMESKEIANILL